MTYFITESLDSLAYVCIINVVVRKIGVERKELTNHPAKIALKRFTKTILDKTHSRNLATSHRAEAYMLHSIRVLCVFVTE